jgi:hypothetical protein
VGVPWIKRCEPGREPPCNWVIPSAPGGLNFQAVRYEEIAERRQRQNVDVLPRLVTRRFADVQSEGIPDRPAGGDIRQRKRLIADCECRQVVPACEILGADNRAAPRAKHASRLLDEVVEPRYMFDHLVRVDYVERFIFERPALIEIPVTNVETTRPCELAAFGDKLHA